jgi:geranyl-CoA carboxylase alpha subunit
MSRVTRILIANRGEIAVRIARTAHRMGLGVVMVFTPADAGNPHLRAGDQARPIESYLDIEGLIRAATTSGADAIHPGYGFLAENARFAAAAEAAGLTFIGPPASAIEAMGDKARARIRMAAAGIPVVPGYDGADQAPQTLTREAARIGYPIMIKASAGGGGRGMRRVDGPEAFADAVVAARNEAEKAFGDGRLILERCVIEPRHVEVQVFADRGGRTIHLGERDCSVQRRHQKVIEEAPSPAVDADLRARLGATAVAVAQAVGYVGAGTVEFLLDRAGAFFFMEMNTRLQVEHPVTELVTGLDLVEWQIRVARGEPLPKGQDEIRLDGHAIEVRLCAEDPAQDFLPRTGTVLAWAPSPTLRADHAIEAGLNVSPDYDSMLAKLVAWAPTRAEAVARLRAGLEETILLGITSNRAFLAKALAHPVFADGRDVSTGFIARYFPDGASRAAAPDEAAWQAAAQAALADEAIPPRWAGWSNSLPLPLPWHLSQGDETRRGTIEPAAPAAGIATVRSGTEIWVGTALGDWAFTDRRRAAPLAGKGGPGDGTLRAPMNGKVTRILRQIGEAVGAGETILTLEAMKMEHALTAPFAGTLTRLAVALGDQVAPLAILAEIAPGEPS